MNIQLVHSKTQKGQEEISTRAYNVAQRFRQVLLQIDGKRTVGDLITHLNNSALVIEALGFLTAHGFITEEGTRATAARSSPVNGKLFPTEIIRQSLQRHLPVYLGPVAGIVIQDGVPSDQKTLTSVEVIELIETISREIDAVPARHELFQKVAKDIGI